MTLAKFNHSHPLRNWLGWDPFQDLVQATRTAQGAQYLPTFELSETDDAYLVSADLPGVRQEDLEVTFHGRLLTVKGKRESVTSSEGETFHVQERTYGTFARQFSLPETADGSSIKADLKDGVLSIRIGKTPESKPIKVSIG